MPVPYTFATQTGNIPLAELDANFANVKAAADTAAIVTSNAQPNITSVGTLTSLSVAGNITAGNIIGNSLTAVYAATAGTANTANTATTANTANTATTANTVTTAAQANITSVGTLTTLSVSGNTNSGNLKTTGIVSATGNITGNYFIGDGSQLINLPGVSYSNSNVSSFLAAYGSNTITTTGNITGGNIRGYSVYANGIVSVNGNVDATQFHGSVFGNNVLSNLTVTSNDHFQFNVSNVANVVYINDGGLTVAGSLDGFILAGGNISGANINANGLITGANIHTSGRISAVGAIFGSNAVISGALSANTIGANTYTGGAISVAGACTSGNTFINGLLSSTGNITGANVIGYSFYANGIVSVTGNVDAQQFHGSVFGNNVLSNLTITSNDHFQFNVGNIANTVYISDGSMYISGFISASGNISGSNISAANDISGANIHIGGRISAGGAIFGSNAVISGAVNGNTVGANIFTGGQISVAGNISGNNVSATTALRLPFYANTSARDLAVSTPVAGMLVFVGNTFQGYDGSVWGNITLT